MIILARNNTGALTRDPTTGALCICPAASEYIVLFPSSDGYTYERSYPLTEADGIWVGGGEIYVEGMFPIPDDIAFNNLQFPFTTYTAAISIEMAIDGGTGERSVRVVTDVTIVDMSSRLWTGQSDYTEVFADGTTFNLSESSSTVRPVTVS